MYKVMPDMTVPFWILPEQNHLSIAKHPEGIDHGRFWEGTEDHRDPPASCKLISTVMTLLTFHVDQYWNFSMERKGHLKSNRHESYEKLISSCLTFPNELCGASELTQHLFARLRTYRSNSISTYTFLIVSVFSIIQPIVSLTLTLVCSNAQAWAPT